MEKVSIVIPNYNGMQYVKTCLDSLRTQTMKAEILFVDNGSADGSREYVEQEYPEVKVLPLPENLGFCGAVNLGIRESKGEYVILLNNDTQVESDFTKALYEGIQRKKKAFSAAAKMIQFHDHSKMDDGGNYYNALGWAFAYGKDQPAENYGKERKIFASCGGAAIYRKDLVEQLGGFDEEHFAYLEDIDLGYRAQIAGYENWYLPEAVVYHVGSGTSGSRYNQFKIRYSSRNNVYMIYKNMPVLQLILNLPLLIFGFAVKLLFFASKGFGREYAAGIKNGCAISRREKKVPFRWKNLGHYVNIQLQLWVNVVRRFL